MESVATLRIFFTLITDSSFSKSYFNLIPVFVSGNFKTSNEDDTGIC